MSTDDPNTIEVEVPGLGPSSEPAPWPAPLPLVDPQQSEPYPLDALPEVIRAAVEEVQAFVKAPLPMVASAALAPLALAAQAYADVQRAEKLSGPSSLFLLGIADSGERKTTCEGFFLSGIRQYEAEARESQRREISAYRAKIASWEAQKAGCIDAIRKCATRNVDAGMHEERLKDIEEWKPEPVRVPRLLRGEETPDALAWSLMREWPASGVMSSEAGVILGGHGMKKDSMMRNLAVLNILWDGGSHSVGRRTSESFTVSGARLSISLQIQAQTLRSFFEASSGLARGTGFLARFLIYWPESTQGARFYSEPPEHWPALARFHRHIAMILEHPPVMDREGALLPTLLHFDAEAKKAWVNFHDAIEKQIGAGGELYDVRDVAAKSADNAARLAALFHVFQHGAAGHISADTFARAARIAAWHLSEARRFFGEIAVPEDASNAARLDGWLIDWCRKKGVSEIAKSDIARQGPAPLREKTALNNALAELEDLCRIRLSKETGRMMVQINPALVGVPT
jgi:putative DNA primase/helicase